MQPLLEAATTLQVATGIVNIWTAAAGPVAESFHRIDAAFPNRFILGIGVGHPEAHTEYENPTTRSSSASPNWMHTGCRGAVASWRRSDRRC